MTLTYVVNEVTPIDYSDDSVKEIGRFETLDAALAAARMFVPEPAHGSHDESFARIEVQGWKA